MDEMVSEKTGQIIEEYFKNNEIIEFDQFYYYYVLEISNFKPKEIPSKDEIKGYLKSKQELEYDENRDIFWLKHQEYQLDFIKSFNNLKDLIYWKVVILVSLSTEENFKDILELEKDFKQNLEIQKKKIYQNGPFLYITWENESFFVETRIKNSFFEITSYVMEKKESFIDLFHYAFQESFDNPKLQETLLLFPHISGAFTAYQEIRKVFKTIYNNNVSFKINDIKIKKGNRC